MPLYKTISINEFTTAYFWHITEDVTSLFKAVSLKDTSLFRLEGMKSVAHQQGFLAVRMLLQHLGYTDYDLSYDELGKPHLMDGKQVSISHSHEFSCICISEVKIGIDIEKSKEKILKIAPRFLEIKHLDPLSTSDQITKATIIWGIKESIFKIKNEAGISFSQHIFEDEFNLTDGKCTASLHFNSQIENFNIQFYNIEAYIFVCAFQEK
jgi:phosphopantetheinyl transferase